MSDDSPVEFLRTLYPRPFHELVRSPGDEAPQLVVWTLDPKSRGSRSYWTDSVEAAAAIADECCETEHVFFGVTLQNESTALDLARRHRPQAELRTVRGRVDSAAVLTAIWVDLDVAGPTHSSDTLPPDLETALGLLDAIDQPVSALVSTGSGVHAYWLLDDPWILATQADRLQAAELVARVQWAIRRLAEEQGYLVDATADLARVLRMPGTLNHKTLVPKPSRVELLAPERRYHVRDFDRLEALEGDAPATQRGLSQRGLSQRGLSQRGLPQRGLPQCPTGQPQDYGPPADFVAIWDGCSFIRFCHQHQETLPYTLWFAMLTIVARSSTPDLDSSALCHNMSRRYPTYSREETDRKIAEVLRPPGGPITCVKIAALGAYQDHCRQCPQWNGGEPKIKSPIVLGRRRKPLPVLRPSSSAAPEPAPDPEPEPAPQTPDPPSPSPSPPSPPSGATSDDRVEIIITTRENEVVDQVLEVFRDREPNLFQRSGLLVQVVVDDRVLGGAGLHRSAEAPAARPVQEPRIRELVSTHCRCIKLRLIKGAIEKQEVHPPPWLSRLIYHRLQWPLPRLEGVVEGPVLRPDGTVLQTPGYDPASGLYLAPSGDFEPVPERPSEEQKEEALLRLMEAVSDFPFAGDAHFSAWLASLLTPLARFAFAGPSPVNLIDANVRGAGKSLLADVCHMIVTGRPAARMPYVRDEGELRKQITAIALKARQLAVIDNVSGRFGSPTLDLAFTTSRWADRLLGQSVDLELPLAVTWYVTGNNIELAGDMPRRCLHIRLETPLEKPEHRQGFRHPRLLEWLAVERRRLLPAALTLLRAYLVERPEAAELRPWGSFEGWSDLIRGAIVWLGLEDPAATCDALEATADVAASTRKRLLQGLDELLTALGGPATVHQILESLDSPDGRTRFETLGTALVEAFPRLKSGELPTPVQLGRKLRSLRGRVIDGLCAVPLEKTRKGVLWSVETRASAAA